MYLLKWMLHANNNEIRAIVSVCTEFNHSFVYENDKENDEGNRDMNDVDELLDAVKEPKNYCHGKETNAFRITNDIMMIIGKYLESNNDFINVMKVAKRYHDLAQMYHFNPISDCELFENMETQHFYRGNNYNKNDGMFQYVYWYNIMNNNKQSNEIFKFDPFNLIFKNMSVLENWCGNNFNEILYDSNTDGSDSFVFRSKILGHSKLYFIVIDNDNNVFGHYHPSVIDPSKQCNVDNDIFLFTLYSNERSKQKKFKNIMRGTYTCIYNDTKFFRCGNLYDSCYCVSVMNKNYSWVGSHISCRFDGVDSSLLT